MPFAMSTELSSETDLSKLTVVQLREHLKSRSLATSGPKSELIERLKADFTNVEKILDTDGSISKDANKTSAVATEEDALDASLSPNTDASTVQVKKDEDKSEAKDGTVQIKETAKEHDAKEESLDAKTKRALRFGLPLSNDDLKRKRTERFGTAAGEKKPESDDERKKRRLQRFGMTEGATKSDGTTLGNDEVFKKRAQRFGLEVKETAVGKASIGVVEKASLEVLEKRAKRFGFCSDQAEVDIKKMQRAERFGKQS